MFTKDVELGTKGSTTGGSGGGSTATADDDDGDGLSNSVETLYEMEEKDADSDQDGFGDGIEFVGDQADPLSASDIPEPFSRAKTLASGDVVTGELDRDNDGLGDGFESDHGLDPEDPDSDDDGYQDGLELVAQSNPFDNADRPSREAPPASDGISRTGQSPTDSDSDGLSDDREGQNGSNPSSFDSDSDGFSDGLEYLMGSNENSAASIPNFNVPAAPTSSS